MCPSFHRSANVPLSTDFLNRMDKGRHSCSAREMRDTRDDWITKMYPSVPAAAKGLARIQPVFGKKTVFNGLGPFLAKTAETSNSATVMQAVTSSLKKPSFPKKANEKKKDSGKPKGQFKIPNVPKPLITTPQTPSSVPVFTKRGGGRGGRGRGSFRGSGNQGKQKS
jgi:hypothetical protein